MMRSWSVSSIRSFHGCQLAWWLRRTGVTPESRPLALVEGTALHAVLEFHLKGMRDTKTPSVEDALELLDATYFFEEAGGVAIRYGKKTREEVLAHLRALYLHWRETAQPTGTILGVEEKLYVELPGLDLPLLGYADLVMKTPGGVQVIDFKVTASNPWVDQLLDPLDLQKLAMTRGYERQHVTAVTGWGWTHLVKTKTPQVVHRGLPVSGCDRVPDLLRLADIVNPTLAAMEAALEGWQPAVPTTAFGRMCQTCPYRSVCADQRGGPPPTRATRFRRGCGDNAPRQDKGGSEAESALA